MQKITSTKNPRVVSLRALRDGKARQAAGCFLVEGAKLCAEAVRDARVETVLADETKAEQFAALLAACGDVLLAPAHVVAAVSSAKTPQGICAAVRMPPPLDLQEARGALLILDGVQDPGNVGTMLRTAEAAGFSGAMLSPACADAFGPKAVQASMGAVLRLPIWRGALAEAIGYLQGRGMTVISAELGGAPYADVLAHVRLPMGLVVGSEGGGVSEAVSAMASARVSLPMRGRAESLNAAVAAGILMYAAMDSIGRG